VYSREVLKKIAICGGFFSPKMFSEQVANSLNKFIRREQNIEIISTRRRQETGFLLKIPDSVLSEYYEYDARKRFKLLTVKGEKEFQRRVREYMKINEINQDVSNQYKKNWYKEIFQKVLEDDEFSSYTRYSITDYKLFVCFTRIFAAFDSGIRIIPKKLERKFCMEHSLIEHRLISTGITYGYDYSQKKIIVLVSDFMKSDKSLIQILEYYSDDRFEIMIYSFRPAEKIEDKLRAKLMKESSKIAHFKFINNPFLNKFFGEY
jgi:hypothetical protein